MATWCIFDKDGKRISEVYENVPSKGLPPGGKFSFRNQYYGNALRSPCVKFRYRTAEGTIGWSPTDRIGVHMLILEVVGEEIADMKVVINRLEDEIGVKVLNPRLYLPENLKGPLEKINYLLGWIFGK